MTQHLTADALRKDFLAVFGQEADQTFFSPGRINLIGEHTDYNGGHVFPAAIYPKWCWFVIFSFFGAIDRCRGRIPL